MLEEVLCRAQLIGSDEVICAIPDTKENDVLVEVAGRHAKVFRGPEHDVLARYYLAAVSARADYIVRITADCPLIWPPLCEAVLRTLIQSGADYACNNMPRTYPHGLDCEAFTFRALRKAHKRAWTKAEREHVTPYLRTSPSLTKINIAAPEVSHERCTLDTEEDYQAILGLFDRCLRAREIPRDIIPVDVRAQRGRQHQPSRSA